MAAKKMIPNEPPRDLTLAERALVARFVQAMDAAEVSSNALAKRTGVDRRTIDRLRNGRRIPRPEKLGRLVQPLGVSLDWIISGDARERVMLVSEPSGPAYRADALSQSAVGFLLRMRDSGLEDWMKRQPPSKTPSLDAALAALDAYDTARASGALLLHSADGRPVMDWSSFFARSTAPQDAPATTRNVLDEAEAGQPLRLVGPAKNSTKPKK